MAANKKIKCVLLTMAKTTFIKSEQEMILLTNWLESAQQASGQLIHKSTRKILYLNNYNTTLNCTVTWWHNDYCHVITDYTNPFNYV